MRDARYWRGQLRTAGTPGEDFRVAERGGAIAAYARAAHFAGRVRVLEYARRPDGADALADLLTAQTAAPQSLPIPDARDPELARALEARGFELSPVGDSSAMWRVLDASALARIANLPPTTADPELLDPPSRYRLGHVLALRSLLERSRFARGVGARTSTSGFRSESASEKGPARRGRAPAPRATKLRFET